MSNATAERVTYFNDGPYGIELGRGDPNKATSPASTAFASVASTPTLHERILEHLDLVTAGDAVTRPNGAHVLGQATRLAELSLVLDSPSNNAVES